MSLPTDHRIISVSTTPIPGWTATTTKVPLNPPAQTDDGIVSEAVSAVTWTADPGVRIEPGQYLDFPLSLGPLPTDTDRLVIPAVQTYDNGEIVRWDQPPSADGSEPEQPAPVVALSPATDEQSGHMAAPAAETPAAGTPTGGTDTTARWLGGAGLLVGALGSAWVSAPCCAPAAGRADRSHDRSRPARGRGDAARLTGAPPRSGTRVRPLSPDQHRPGRRRQRRQRPQRVSLTFNESLTPASTRSPCWGRTDCGTGRAMWRSTAPP